MNVVYASADFKWKQHILIQRHEIEKLLFFFTRLLSHTKNSALLCRQPRCLYAVNIYLCRQRCLKQSVFLLLCRSLILFCAICRWSVFMFLYKSKAIVRNGISRALRIKTDWLLKNKHISHMRVPKWFNLAFHFKANQTKVYSWLNFTNFIHGSAPTLSWHINISDIGWLTRLLLH